MSAVASENALPIHYKLSEYEIVSVLGAGGFGITYMANDAQLGSRVAIKEYFPQSLAERNAQYGLVPRSDGRIVKRYHWGLQQFLKEARSLARFKHPNIVRVLRYIEGNGTAYMVMEYEEGRSLETFLKKRKGRLDERRLLAVFLPILNGLHAVHEAGLLHLDIKPDNIYLTKDGRPMLIDFGSARRTNNEEDLAGPTVLTPAYAAIEHYPDQGDQGPWTDVYSLGASMYECVTGKRPSKSMDRYQASLKYLPDPVQPLSQMKPPGFSDYVCESIDWAMQVHASHRPQTANDLQKGLMGKRRSDRKKALTQQIDPDNPPPKPKYLGPQQNTVDYLRLARLGIIGVVLILAVVVGKGVLEYKGDLSIKSLLQQEKVVDSGPAFQRRERELPPSQSNQAKQDKIEVTEPGPSKLIYTLRGHSNWVFAIDFISATTLASAGGDGSIKLWDTRRGRLKQTLHGHKGAVRALAATLDGKYFASGGDDTIVLLWRKGRNTPVARLKGHDYRIHSLKFSPDGKTLASASQDETIILWDIPTRRKRATLLGYEEEPHAMAYTADSRYLIVGGPDTETRFWDVSNGQVTEAFRTNRRKVTAVAVSYDGEWFTTSGPGGLLKVWRMKGRKFKNFLNGAQDWINSMSFRRDGRWYAAGGNEHTVLVWGLMTNEIRELKGHEGFVESVAFSPDNATLATAGRDNTIRIWR